MSPAIWRLVGFLAAVEIASGVLQGYYTPLYSDIATHLGIGDGDVNWFEAAQLIVAALAIPVLARLGDLHGHRRVLVGATLVTAMAGWLIAFAPGFWTFLIGWALQGVYTVWLPMEIAILHERSRDRPDQPALVRRGAALLVLALEIGVIAGALSAGALQPHWGMTAILSVPAAATTIALVAILLGVRDAPATATGRLDLPGTGLLTVGLVTVLGGLVVVRLQGLTSPLAWLLVLSGLLVLVAFVRVESASDSPLIDVRALAAPAMWPVQLAAALFGMSVLGAQIPLSTFARTDPAEVGYGLGVDAGAIANLIGLYVVSMAVGALLSPVAARRLGVKGMLVGSAVLVAVGYAIFLPLHGQLLHVMLAMGVVGLGSGALVASLPAAAAQAAQHGGTAEAAGLTNATKTVGGCVASALFAVALASTGSISDPAAGHAPMSGYLTVWGICSGSALVAAVVLSRLPTADREFSLTAA
ncbi:MFS transporter [Janibacter sp. GS2]|uniref:MFS transporter n=1 Tax=Janibacter sp. GS2 TaxID=3442646 RepID=UPI003EBABD49